MTEFRRKIIDYGVLFDAITIGVSIFSGPRVNAGFVRAATAASLTYFNLLLNVREGANPATHPPRVNDVKTT